MPLTLTVSEAEGFELHEPDEWYDGTIRDIEETDGQWGPGLKFIIELDGETDRDGNPREQWAFCSQKLSKRSKLYGWAKGLGWDPDDDTLDLTEYVDTRCQVMFEHAEGFDTDGNAVTRDKVVKVRKGKGKAPVRTERKVKRDDYDDAPF
jgi:hypothetical protein